MLKYGDVWTFPLLMRTYDEVAPRFRCSTLLLLAVSLLNTHLHTPTAATQRERGASGGGHGEKVSPSLPPSHSLPLFLSLSLSHFLILS